MELQRLVLWKTPASKRRRHNKTREETPHNPDETVSVSISSTQGCSPHDANLFCLPFAEVALLLDELQLAEHPDTHTAAGERLYTVSPINQKKNQKQKLTHLTRRSSFNRFSQAVVMLVLHKPENQNKPHHVKGCEPGRTTRGATRTQAPPQWHAWRAGLRATLLLLLEGCAYGAHDASETTFVVMWEWEWWWQQ